MNKYNRRIYLIIILIINFILTGCWDNNELDTISIVTGLGIDAAENDDEIDLTLQVSKIKGTTGYEKGAVGQGSSFFVMEATDSGILSGIDKLEKQIPRSIFLHHNQVIIFGKEQAKKGIKKYMDVFIREHQMRMETWVLLSDSTAKDTLTSTMEQEENSAIGLSKMIYSESRDYESLSMRLMDLTSRMMEETTSPVIPIVTVKNKNGNSEAEISGLAILKEDKYIGELDLEKVRGYSWIMGNCREISFNINIEDGYSDMSISNIKLKNKPKLGADGPFISIDFKGDVAIREIQGFEGMKTDEIFAILQKACVEQLEKEILDCFNYSKDLNADIYGFGTEFYRKHPKDFEKLKEYWDEIYPELDMELEINLEITDTGKVLNSLYMEEQSDENR